MKLFDFKLKEIHEITPWGEAGALSLHWFGLTDGYYHLNAGRHELFRYSEEILAHWKTGLNSAYSSYPYPDYQVVRLYEDILEIFPCVAQPIPDYIFDQFRTLDSFEDFLARLNRACDGTDSEKNEKFDQIRSFLWTRRLDSGHLVQGPNIWFFRNSDSVYIRWLNEDKLIDGIPVWKEKKGEAVIPFDIKFCESVKTIC
jgi:hypothetical protein